MALHANIALTCRRKHRASGCQIAGFTKFASNVSACITVRDAGSGALLESLGVPKDRITVTGDAVFGLPLEDESAVLAGLPQSPRIACSVAVEHGLNLSGAMAIGCSRSVDSTANSSSSTIPSYA
jgi:hypothetical protein